MSSPWWRGAVGYEVYVRSFADSDGDGVGDLPGLRKRLDHIASLGVDFLWITPFYPSPMADHGYDVADYTGVDPRFGTLADLDGVVADAHELGLRVLIDLVPNHTSSDHPWFRASRSSREDPHRGWYVWRDPAPDGGPPNNWVSHFGGPAWTYDEATGQYWLHLFLPEQPDLDWTSPDVRAAFDDVIRFWLERGVDGFRIDVAHALVKASGLPDNPRLEGAAGGAVRDAFQTFEHRYDLDQPEVTEIYRRWNRLAAEHDALLLGEVYLLDPARVERYVRDQDGLHLALCIPATRTTWDAAEIRDVLVRGVRHGGGAFAWPIASHDDAHAPTRFGGGERGRERAMAYLTLLMGLPGVVLLYQGDELALPNGEVPPELARDPIAVRNPGDPGGRDGVRTPMPWEPGAPSLGFTDGEPWLPMGGRDEADTVAAQEQRPGSHLHRTRALVALRRSTEDLRGDAAVEWLGGAGASGSLIAYRRGGHVVAANVGAADAELELPPGRWRVVFRSDRGPVDEPVGADAPDAGGRATVPAERALVARAGISP